MNRGKLYSVFVMGKDVFLGVICLLQAKKSRVLRPCFHVIIACALFFRVAVGVLALPVPAVADHFVNPVLGFPT